MIVNIVLKNERVTFVISCSTNEEKLASFCFVVIVVIIQARASKTTENHKTWKNK